MNQLFFSLIAFSLLTLSLNAQNTDTTDGANETNTPTDQYQSDENMNQDTNDTIDRDNEMLGLLAGDIENEKYYNVSRAVGEINNL